MMKSGEDVSSQDEGDPEMKRVSRPGSYSTRNKGPNLLADHLQAQSRPSCTKCGNKAHVNKNTCPATDRRCLKCGCLNHFNRMCNSAADDVKAKRANAVELEQEPNTPWVS